MGASYKELYGYLNLEYIASYIKNFRKFDEDLLNKFSIIA